MKMIELAFIRNELYNNRFASEYIYTLESVKNIVKSNGTPYKSLIVFCIDLAIEDIRKKFFHQAAEEINFIHNFPIQSDFNLWNADHFFNIELLGYIEKNEDSVKLRTIIKKISEFC